MIHLCRPMQTYADQKYSISISKMKSLYVNKCKESILKEDYCTNINPIQPLSANIKSEAPKVNG